MPSSNPLLQGLHRTLPAFHAIQPEHVLPALVELIRQQRAQLQALSVLQNPTWETLMEPLEAMNDALARVWGPVSHLNSVCDSDALRPVYEQGLQEISAWDSERSQNKGVFQALLKLAQCQIATTFNTEQTALLNRTLRDFRLAGAELPDTQKTRFKTLRMRLSELTTQFEQHVLDATAAFTLHISEQKDLAGLPDSVQQAAAQRATQAKQSGWLFTLDMPSYLPFMQYAECRDLRQQLYTAYVTRASHGSLDNSPVMDEILDVRQQMAELLGFTSYADYSLASKMATSVEEITGFLRELASKSKPVAEQEIAQLHAFAKEQLGLKTLEAWDIPYASEKLRLHRYAISDEEIKPYLPETRVISGLFALAERLYGIRIQPAEAPCWVEDARFFDVLDSEGNTIAGFYLDPYARAHKRGGAWMDECITRWRKSDGSLQHPIAYLVCNFDAPVHGKPALWTHDEVNTLFHEFGHGLHHMLTRVDTRGVSGIHGVPWDAVEMPSQLMENFCWERDVLTMLSGHIETGESIPDTLFTRMLSAKNFQSGMQMLRQIEFALFDMLLHSIQPTPQGDMIHQLLEQVRHEIAVLIPPAFNRFEHAFSHIFAGGYAAGYYSYKWAEVLSADVYAAFEEAGSKHYTQIAERFRHHLLGIGSSRDLMEAFSNFRGRPPSVDHLLRHSGLKPLAT